MQTSQFTGENVADPVSVCELAPGDLVDIHVWDASSGPEESSYWYGWDGSQWRGTKNADDNVFITQPVIEDGQVRINANRAVSFVATRIRG